MKAALRRFIDSFEDPGLRAVELLVPLTIFFRELNNKFEVRTMEAGVSKDLPVADSEDALQVRYVLRKKSGTSAT